MTILVKNEADIIEHNLIFHHAMGVDGFIVTDNNSTDGTRAILDLYKAKGWIKEIIDESADAFSQATWVDRMVRLAKDKHGADWVINADADEFWSPATGSLKTELMATIYNVLIYDSYSVMPENDPDFYTNTLLAKKPLQKADYDLAPFNIFNVSLVKVMHRTKGYRQIRMGNHSVIMRQTRRRRSKNVTIYHYCVRSREHFWSKMLTGGAACERNHALGKEICNHWRYFYEGSKHGSVDVADAYERFIGSRYWAELLDNGVLERSTAVAEFFHKMPMGR